MTDLSLVLWMDSERSHATSVAALRHVEASGRAESLRELVIGLLLEHRGGLSYDELSHLIVMLRPGTKDGSIRPRVIELRREGVVVSATVMRGDTASGIPHLVWQLNPEWVGGGNYGV